jgi:hypothetical protein
MRARNIKPGFFQNEELAVLLPITRLLFAGLWCLADREGRLEDRARRIRAEVFPYEHGDSLDIHRELTALEQAGFVRRHTVRGLRLIDIPNFKKHQSPHHTERASRLPGWDERDQPQDIDTNEFTNAPDISPSINGGDTVNSPEDLRGNPPDSLILRFTDSKSIAHSENERASKPSKAEACRPSGSSLSTLAANIYAEYPRKVGKQAALKAFAKAIHTVATRGTTESHPDFHGDDSAAADWLRKKVVCYRSSPEGQQADKRFIPHPVTWANEGRYDDDDREWSVFNPRIGDTNGSQGGLVPKLPSDYVPASERIRQERSRRLGGTQ